MQCRNLGKTGGMRWKVGESSMEGLEGGKFTSIIWGFLNPFFVPDTVLGARDMMKNLLPALMESGRKDG